MRKEHWPVYIAVFLIAASNAIKGTVGLYSLDRDTWNLVSSILLSLGVEVLLFYAVMRWSARRGWTAALYAVGISLAAGLLNWLFFQARVEAIELSIGLATIGPFVACIGGLVVGEVERVEVEAEVAQRDYDLAMAQVKADALNQKRLIAMHNRKAEEAKAKVAQPMLAGPAEQSPVKMTKKEIKAEMFAEWTGDSGISLTTMSHRYPRSKTMLRNYKDEMVRDGIIEEQPDGGRVRYVPLNGA